MLKKHKIVVISGAFDPIHIGHIRLIKEAKKLGDKLIVILNNDNWSRKKKKHIFMHQKERKEILEAIQEVDEVIISSHPKNTKDLSVDRELTKIKPDIFANGGRKKSEHDILEADTCHKIGCQMVFGVGKGGKIQSSSWLLSKYVDKLKARRQLKIKKILNDIQKAMRSSKVNLPIKLKLKVSEIMLSIMNRKRAFGLFVILGWKNKWKSYTNVPDFGQDIYVKHHINVYDLKSRRSHKYNIGTTINFDGAVLVDLRGDIIHSGIIIEGLKPKVIADKINPGHFKDLSDQFGFGQKVHSRHLSAIAASYMFKGTTVFTISEETDSFHIFEKGEIVYTL